MFTSIVRGLAHVFAKYNILLGIVYASLSLCICTFVAYHLRNNAPIMARITHYDCHFHVGALRHSMPVVTVRVNGMSIQCTHRC